MRVALAFTCALWATAPAAQDWCGAERLNPSEETICGDTILSAFDRQLNLAYEAAPAGPVKAGQLDWLRRRDACGTDILCIEREYRLRIEQLRAAREEGAILRPWCTAGTLTPTERAICGSERLASLDAAMEFLYQGVAGALPEGDQARWRATRDACGTDRDCIAASYHARIETLGSYLR